MKSIILLVSLALVGLVASTAIQNDIDFCGICQDVVTKAEKIGSDSDAWLKAHISEICDHFRTETVKDFCLQQLQKVSDALGELVKKQVAPKEACESVKLC